MNIIAHSKFEAFAEKFVRAYWETVKSDAFSMPPDEPVHETIQKLLSEISHETEVRHVLDHEGGLHLLPHEQFPAEMDDDSHFERAVCELGVVTASASSDSEIPRDFLVRSTLSILPPFLRHVERVANDTKSI